MNTVVMLMLCLPTADPSEFLVGNLPSLVLSDWHAASDERLRVLSLRPGADFTKGTAWLIQLPSKGAADLKYGAWKGQFTVGRGPDEDAIILRLAFTKQYDLLRNGKEIEWQLYTRFKPIGTDAVITLDDGNRIPDTELSVSFSNAFFVDEMGQPTQRYSEGGSFLDRLKGPRVRRAFLPGFADEGETVRFSPTRILPLSFVVKPPPTFRFRPKQEEASKRAAEEVEARAAEEVRQQQIAERLRREERGRHSGIPRTQRQQHANDKASRSKTWAYVLNDRGDQSQIAITLSVTHGGTSILTIEDGKNNVWQGRVTRYQANGTVADIGCAEIVSGGWANATGIRLPNFTLRLDVSTLSPSARYSVDDQFGFVHWKPNHTLTHMAR